jgi:hypothetical protein
MSERTPSTSPWRKSSRSNGNGGNNCVEVALLERVIAVRDSKNPSGPALSFSPVQWNAFLDGAKDGKFDIAN